MTSGGFRIAMRLGQAVLTVFGVAIVVFGGTRLSGDPAKIILESGGGGRYATYVEIRKSLGLDRPLIAQFGDFIGRALRGDLGTSYWQDQPVSTLISQRLPATAELAGAALLVIIVLGLLTGLVGAIWPKRMPDLIATSWNGLGMALPVFWAGPLLILLFSVRWHVFPTSGRGGITHLVLPAVTLALLPAAQLGRVVRSEMLDILLAEHVLSARARGVRESFVFLRHGLRPALLPVVTLIGTQFGALLGGAVITETIFAWPGVGLLLVQALERKDFPLVQGIALYLSAAFVLVNLLVDLSYRRLDPRITESV